MGARIIPARAGFTFFTDQTEPSQKDHPRSRGVYVAGPSTPSIQSWIIPARAGFTHPGDRRRRGRQDHPRSRGVYGSSLEVGNLMAGSSPLARGLPAASGAASRIFRIIPARAGFTQFVALLTHAVSDHPRSRGVY